MFVSINIKTSYLLLRAQSVMNLDVYSKARELSEDGNDGLHQTSVGLLLISKCVCKWERLSVLFSGIYSGEN